MDNDNGNIGASDAAVLALLADTARAGRGGYGYGGEGFGGYFGAGTYGPVFQHSIDHVNQKIEDQADCTREVIGGQNAANMQAFENLTRAGEINRICDRLSDIDTRNSDQRFQSELRNSDRIAALQAQVNDFRAEAAKCCCDTKLELCNVKSDLLSRMEALSKEGILRDLNRAERQLQTQTILSSCGCGCGGGVRPCPNGG